MKMKERCDPEAISIIMAENVIYVNRASIPRLSQFIGEHPALIIPILVDILTLKEQNQN